MKKELKYINKKIKDIEDKINNPIEYNLPTINAKVRIDNSAGYTEELEILKSIRAKLDNNNKILIAKQNGFFNGYDMWIDEDFVIDYDTVRKEFYLRSITKGYGLGKTRFYESDYKKTWWLKEDKSE